MGLNVIFMGSAGLSCPSLDALIESPGARVQAVVTQPDRPKGRHLRLTPSPVKEAALRRGLAVLQPEKARSPEFFEELRRLGPDLIVVVAYGQILPLSILELPRHGCINVHTSILPKYRGAAPIQWAILNGETETGVTIMKMDQGLDTGPILTQARVRIAVEDNSAALHDKLAVAGAELLVRTIAEYVSGNIVPRPQPSEGASYASKIRKQDGDIVWREPAAVVWNRVRGMTPWPGASAYLHEGGGARRLKILRAEAVEGSGQPGSVLRADQDGIVVACGTGALKVAELQLEGGRPMEARQFLAGHEMAPGYVFAGAGCSPSSQ
jgi:methionyl-tRNA formyltransferase